MTKGLKWLVGIGVGALVVRHFGNNIITHRVFEAGLASKDDTELAEAIAFLRSRGDNTGADVLQARRDSLKKV